MKTRIITRTLESSIVPDIGSLSGSLALFILCNDFGETLFSVFFFSKIVLIKENSIGQMKSTL